jgi:hypothetical protein
MKIGDRVIFLGSPSQGIPKVDGEFTVEQFIAGGDKAEDIFNQPMVVLAGTDFGWIPASSVKPKPMLDNSYRSMFGSEDSCAGDSLDRY